MDKSKQTPADRKGPGPRRAPAPEREPDTDASWRPADDVVGDASSRHPVDTDLDLDKGAYSTPPPKPKRG